MIHKREPIQCDQYSLKKKGKLKKDKNIPMITLGPICLIGCPGRAYVIAVYHLDISYLEISGSYWEIYPKDINKLSENF